MDRIPFLVLYLGLFFLDPTLGEVVSIEGKKTPTTDSSFPSLCGHPTIEPDVDVAFFPNGSIKLPIEIVGGHPAIPYSWPWAVNFWAKNKTSDINGWYFFCGGSLINNQWILTAAHCFPETNFDFLVKLGSFNKGVLPQVYEDTEKVRGVANIIVHPHYDPTNMFNDIALVKMDYPVEFTSAVQPICIPDSFDISTGERVVVVGWGTTESGGSVSEDLLQIVIKAVSFSQCNEQYDDELSKDMFCAAAPGKDSCQGDSGGPVVSKRNGVWFQSGVVSFGKGCAHPDYAGVYTRVANYKTWITTNICSVGCRNAEVIPRACPIIIFLLISIRYAVNVHLF